MDSSALKERLIAAKANKLSIEKELLVISNKLFATESENKSLVKARWAVTEVTNRTQILFKDRVDSLTTLALRSVFDRDFRFEFVFERKRNKPECRPVIYEGDNEYDNIEFYKGGGIIPIIGFALRVVIWSLQKPRSRRTFVLDEPTKGAIGTDGDLLAKTALMLKEISSKLKIQLIIVTHEHSFLDIADRAWRVMYANGESGVQMIKGEAKEITYGSVRRLKRRKAK